MTSINYSTGRRKESVARVYLSKGKGEITVNDKAVDHYFKRKTAIMIIKQPLELLSLSEKIDVKAFTKGGGLTGQAGAIRLGIAKAITEMDEELRLELKKAGLLTRDSRSVERKKVGFRKARKKEQYSKR